MGVSVAVAGTVAVDVASKDDLANHTDRLAKLLERPHARFLRAYGAAAPRAANLPFAIRLQPSKPPAGWLWLVQWIILMGDDPSISVAIANVRAAVFNGAIPTDASLSGGAALVGADFANTILTGLAVPSTNTIPDKNVVYSMEELYAIIAGIGTVAGATTYRMVVGLIELPQTPEALTW